MRELRNAGRALLAGLLLAGAAAARTPSECLPELAAAEARYHVPAGLLVSMAIVESGRTAPDGTISPWPWTIHAQGQGKYFESSEEAQRAARLSLEGGDALIDVGCLQVDLYHHPDAFPTLAAAFDPRRNVDYAARYLSGLARTRRSWLEAVAAYNAGRPADGIDYLSRVLYLWRGIKLTAAAARPAGEDGQRGFALDEMPGPLDVAARFYAGRDFAAAGAVYADLLRHHPDDPTALAGSGEVLLAEGRIEAARDHFERALIATRGDHPAALSGLMRAIDALPPASAMTALLSARAAAPSAAEIPARLAELQAKSGDLADAVETMGEAVRLAPADPVRQLDYALLLDRAGAERRALAAYARFLADYRPDGSPAIGVSLDSVRRRVDFLRDHTP